jgi:hypothetical protein
MQVSVRFSIAAIYICLYGIGVYACSSDSDISIPNPKAPEDASLAATDGATQNDSSSPPKDSGGGTDSGPKTCTYLNTAGDATPAYEPAACRSCVADLCCSPIEKCYGGAPADGGVDGSDGKKTPCALFGECETICAKGPAADQPACEERCEAHYGAQAAVDFANAESCVYGAAPTGCMNVCP